MATPKFIKQLDPGPAISKGAGTAVEFFIHPFLTIKDSITAVLELFIDIPDYDQAEGHLINKESNVAYIPIIYGQKRVGGTTVYRGTSGDNNEYQHIVLELCEGEIESIDAVYIDDVLVTDSRFTGFVTIPKDPATEIAARTRYGYVGTTSQAADATLVAAITNWTTAHQINGVAYLYVQLLYNRDVFSSSKPTIHCDIRGRRVTDTRDTTTTLDTAEAAGQTVLGVAATTSYTVGTTSAVITLDADAAGEIHTHQSTITAISAGVSITINDPLPSAAASGNLVEVARYSPNPALCIRDYLRNKIYGKGLDIGSVDDSAITTAANTCDTRMDAHTSQAAGYLINQTGHAVGDSTVVVDSSSSPIPYDIIQGDTFTRIGDTTQYLVTAVAGSAPDFTLTYRPAARTAFVNNDAIDLQINYFECSGVISTERKVIDNVKLLMTSCRGLLPYISGKYTLLLEQSGSSTFSFDVDNIIGGWSFKKGSKRYRLNTVKAKFANPSKNWRSDIVVQDSPTYRAEDSGLLLEKEIPLLLETNPYRALYMANTVLKKSRNDISVSFTATLAAFDVKAGDIVDVTHTTPGWTNKLFRVVAITLLSSGNMACQLQEHDDAIYNRAAEAGVSFPPDTNLPDPFHTRIAGGDVELRSSNWTERANPKNFALNAVAYGSGLFVAVGDADGTDAYIATSPDGIVWTERTNPKNFDLYDIVYGNSIFVAVGITDGTDIYIITSSDGITWTERANPSNAPYLLGVTYGNSLFVAVGAPDATDADIITSTDGVTWTERANPKAYDLYDVTYANSLFVAVGNPDGVDAYMVSSADGITWAEISNPSNTGLSGITYGSGLFCAVGSPGADTYIITSPDGITWTERANPGTTTLFDAEYAEGIFVGVGGTSGTDALILTSIDGITWVERRNPVRRPLHGIIYSADVKVFMAVGQNDGTDAYIAASLYAK